MARRQRAAMTQAPTMGRRKADQLISMDEQQRLVVERTDRLLRAGKPVPVPPSTDLFATRTALREDVDHLIEDETVFGVAHAYLLEWDVDVEPSPKPTQNTLKYDEKHLKRLPKTLEVFDPLIITL